MRAPGRAANAILLGLGVALGAVGGSGCGDGVIQFPPRDDTGGDEITVEGEIVNVVRPNSVRDITIFVYTDLDPDFPLPVPENLACLTSSDYDSVKTVSVAGTIPQRFSITNVRRGELTVVFLQDQAFPNADGQIDAVDVSGGPQDCANCTDASCPLNPGLPSNDNAVAVLDDDGRLDSVRGGQAVDIVDVQINFSETAVATMSRIDISTRPGDGDDAVRTGSARGGLTIGFSSR